MEVYLNGTLVELDREMVLLGDFLGLQSVVRVPGMKVFVNDEPVGHASWSKYAILDGDKVVYEYPEGKEPEPVPVSKDKYAHLKRKKDKEREEREKKAKYRGRNR